ncbi:hypothetical protein [Bacillus sp. FJAT-27445]|uniref:hypothetical protein n=1 Tax=Bacillus sp. FJAT-27445 TaxID=1679166 RepID=UPI000744018C|nr:hypothetical protein [Bacillus sp. FJAT-27445]
MLNRTILVLVAFGILFHQPSTTSLARSPEVKMAPWHEADKLFPRYAKFTVVDAETGLKFRVQRRAGSRHADVQPLTSNDTAIMKKIYNGKWSWKRRAIYALHGKNRIAASMNGMPHGAGALKNKFPGHFCIHFYKSSTHSKREMDLSHKLMVYKAAGKLEGLLASANPYEAVTYYVAGYKEQDRRIVDLLSIKKLEWSSVFNEVEGVKISRLPMVGPEDMEEELIVQLPIEIEWHTKSRGRYLAKTEIICFRSSPFAPWKIDSLQFIKGNGLLPDSHKES